MKKTKPITAEALEKLFHEPNRLSIMSALCGAPRGLAFTDLKEACTLTDGNLNRHLKVLSESKAVVIKKAFVDDKPRTTVTLSKSGLSRFSEYLAALEQVLVDARAAMPAARRKSSALPRGQKVTA